ncbi:P22 phage major capsid protein family protein [Virgibacillus siamensis]|uniref:P22 phage major capsid protein family protein n=1 Tax=Virgibacillus siamensis TaxID=480071 RepID=UPI000986CF92|nr:P22 phage major capsid protein family protein [Virgibacillus siamensis]
MSVQNFIPELWSARLLANLDKAHVFGSVVNRDYEGEISNQGDTVHIQQAGDISVFDYDKVNGLNAPETVKSTSRDLLIDQAKAFNFMVDDIDKVQANVELVDRYAQRAAYAVNDIFDKYIAGHYVDATHKIGDDASPITIDGTTAYEQLSKMATLLDEANVPQEGRWAVLPPFYYEALRSQNSGAMFEEAKENGRVGRLAGFDLRMSNNVAQFTGDGTATFTNSKVLVGHNMAISVAEQIVKTEAYRPEKFFADAIRGLHVYGSKTTQPDALGVIAAARA